MEKKKIVVTYYEMIVGGSTTALLAFLNTLDKTKYEVDLQLYHNRGPLLDQIPKGVNLLPPACRYEGRLGRVIKNAKYLLTGAALRAYRFNRRHGKRGVLGPVYGDFQAKHLSRKNKKHYDIAIGFLEGWSARYTAYGTNADKKLAWLHSTFANITSTPDGERPWMDKVDNIVFVTDACTEAFKETMPAYADKAITVYNIVDSALLKARAAQADSDDEAYRRFKEADVFKIITVCRATIQVKGMDRMIACAKALKAAGAAFRWLVVGDGTDYAAFCQMIEDADLGDCMVAVGNRLNPYPFIKEADAFCLLSRYEGKPMVITESMILGVPPFVTQYLSAPEQIQNGVEGVIVPNQNDTGMADVLLDYMAHPEKLEAMKTYLSAHDYGNESYMREIELTIL